MNIENTKKVLAYLATIEDEHFNMVYWFMGKDGNCAGDSVVEFLGEVPEGDVNKTCGTAACLAGHVQWGFARTEEEKGMEAQHFAQKFLGLGYADAYDLFRAHRIARPNQNLENVTLDQMIEALKNLAKEHGA